MWDGRSVNIVLLFGAYNLMGFRAVQHRGRCSAIVIFPGDRLVFGLEGNFSSNSKCLEINESYSFLIADDSNPTTKDLFETEGVNYTRRVRLGSPMLL